MFSIKQSTIKDCLELIPKIFHDERGLFVKVFHSGSFKSLGLEDVFKEDYYSKSLKGVIRGLHFQLPPQEHAKIVYCVSGSVFDVVIDLRVGSPTFGQCDTFNLNSNDANMIYIPKGLAHGFCSLSESSTLIYKTSTVYYPEFDSGILWNSVPIDWPVKKPVISDRDSSFKPFSDFVSPFKYG
tara:strand:+ start:6573 stop:7121 length:549 start_codon:yes stop_codon:yes gene_type:complete